MLLAGFRRITTFAVRTVGFGLLTFFVATGPAAAATIVLDTQISTYTTGFDDLFFANQETVFDLLAEGPAAQGDTLEGTLSFISSGSISGVLVEALTGTIESVEFTPPPPDPPATVDYSLSAGGGGRDGLFFAYTSPDFYQTTINGFHALTFDHLLEPVAPGVFMSIVVQIADFDFSTEGEIKSGHLFDSQPFVNQGWTIVKDFQWDDLLMATVFEAFHDESPAATRLNFTLIGEPATQTPIPEPGTMLLVGTGAAVMAYRRRRR